MNSMRKLAGAGALYLCLGLASQAQAAGVPAGTTINNTAEVSYTIGSVNTTTASNQVTVTVAEVLDVDVTAQIPATGYVPVSSGDTRVPVRFVVTNTGNSTEAFLLTMTSTIGGDQYDPVPAGTAIYLDDGDNVFTASDTLYVPGPGNDPLLQADQAVTVFVVNDIPDPLSDGNIGRTRLTAAARTGTGAAGTVIAGGGTNLVDATAIDAIVGTNGADAEVTVDLRVAGVTLTAVKSQSVLDPFGGNSVVPGSIITYTIVVSMSGSGTAANAVFTDVIPAGTTYQPGTLTLDAQPLTDGVDTDDGDYSATAPARVRVDLHDILSTTGPKTVTFRVRINTN